MHVARSSRYLSVVVDGRDKAEKPFALALIFTGHMIDLPGRKPPRFPPEMANSAAAAIRRLIIAAQRSAGGSVVGIASAARGGDILFLDACRDLGIEIRILLPFAKKRFLISSVGKISDEDWNARFEALWRATPKAYRQVLRPRPSQNPYEHCNLRILALAQELAGNTRLIGLWDGREKLPKPGGTASFIAHVRASGGGFWHIDSRKLIP
jgi:hypothetical protein